MDEKIEAHEVVEKHHTKKNKSYEIAEKMRKNPWIVSTVVLGLLVVIFLVGSVSMTGKVISEKDAGELFLNYVGEKGADTSSIEITEILSSKGFYKITFDYEGNPYPAPYYISEDGSLIGLLDEVILEDETSSSTSSMNIPKSDKPEVELFVMSYCPYGTQAEKGIIPVVELLGDAIDFKMRYVSYVMHGEKEATENLREYCIQENNPEKYLDYLSCFLEGDGILSNGYITNGNDVDVCLSEVGIDTSELQTCMAEIDEEYGITKALDSGSTYPRFNIEASLNEEYGVRGSPTLVINGVIVPTSEDNKYYVFNDQKIPFSRSPETYKQIVCSLFSEGNVPESCGTELSSQNPSVYFGWDETSTTSSGNVCG